MGLDVTATYGRASELCSTTKLIAVGDIKSTAGKLYWLLITNASTSARVATLYDDNSGGTGNEIAPFRVGGKVSELFNFDPPIPCDTGISIGQMDGDLTITGGYV